MLLYTLPFISMKPHSAICLAIWDLTLQDIPRLTGCHDHQYFDFIEIYKNIFSQKPRKSIVLQELKSIYRSKVLVYGRTMYFGTRIRVSFNLMNALCVISSQCYYHATVYEMHSHSHMCILRKNTCTQAPNCLEHGGKTPQSNYTYCQTHCSIAILEL